MENEQVLRGFLQKSAEALTKARLIYHPSFVALTEYDILLDTNCYRVLFGDWMDHSYHYAFPHSQWKRRYQGLCPAVNLIRQQHPSLVRLDLDSPTDWRYCAILDEVKRELKKLVFHVPFTGELFRDAISTGSNRSCKPLGNLMIYQAAARSAAEKAKNHEGHWDYGIALEELYLSHPTDRCRVYSVFFFQGESATSVYALTAFCPEVEKGAGVFAEVPDVRQYGFSPLDLTRWAGTIDGSTLESTRKRVKEKLGIPTDLFKYGKAEDPLRWLETEATLAELQRLEVSLLQLQPEGKLPFSKWHGVIQSVRSQL